MTAVSSLDLAADLVARCRALGANEATASVTDGSSVELIRRDRRVEQASEASTRRVRVELLVDDRYSSHSTSDLRPEALETFLRRAVEATRYLEPDPDRRLPDRALCGRSASDDALDMMDPSYAAWTADDRAAMAEGLEGALLAASASDFISGSAAVSDGHSETAIATSHGFADATRGAWFSISAEATLSEPGGRRPEGYAWFASRYRGDLPDAEHVAAQTFLRAREAIGAGPLPSGRYPLLLTPQAAGRIVGALAGPLGGYAIHHQRSCLADKLGARIGSALFTLVDDPHIPRGLGSEPWDDDLLATKRRTVIDAGELRMHYLDTYHARKLGREVTSGSHTNWVIPAGPSSVPALVAAMPKVIQVTGFLGGNTNGLTGDFSLGVRGRLLEHGAESTPIAEMNITGNLTTLFHQLIGVGDDPWAWSSVRTPSLLFDDVQFSGT